jgi:hypothetical protein
VNSELGIRYSVFTEVGGSDGIEASGGYVESEVYTDSGVRLPGGSGAYAEVRVPGGSGVYAEVCRFGGSGVYAEVCAYGEDGAAAGPPEFT